MHMWTNLMTGRPKPASGCEPEVSSRRTGWSTVLSRIVRWLPGACILSLIIGCGSGGAGHPWFDPSAAPPHEILEVGGVSSGQMVILVPAGMPPEEVMNLGRVIAAQAPADATVNARIFDDRQTAREWRTAPAAWTLQHLLVLVTATPGGGAPEVRWTGPEEMIPPDADFEAAPALPEPAQGAFDDGPAQEDPQEEP
jgi:hypothetical protein